MRRFMWTAGIVMAITVAGCDRSDPPGSRTGSTTSTAAAGSAPKAKGSASAAASAKADPAKAAKWSGTYEAKVAKLELPKKVKDLTWKNDEGEKNSGPGKLTFSVKKNVVVGTASGALGDQVISGVFDGKELRATFSPKDPTAEGAMTGTAIGELKGGVLSGTLRCTGPRAAVVRVATFEIKPAG